jgi:hypothetical protein
MMGVLEWRLNFVKHLLSLLVDSNTLEGMVDNKDKDRWFVDNQDRMVVDNNRQDMGNKDTVVVHMDVVDKDMVDIGMVADHLVGCQVWLVAGAVVCVVIEEVVDIGIVADDL